MARDILHLGTGQTVIETDSVRDQRWAQFVESHPEGLIYHHPLWLSALRQEYQQRQLGLMCLDSEQNVTGVLPLFYTRGLPLRVGRNDTGCRLSSLPRTPVCGPLTNDDRSTALLIRAAADIVDRQAGLRLELKSWKDGLDKLVDGLVCVPWRWTYVSEMPSIQATWSPIAEYERQTRNCLCSQACRTLRFGNAQKQHRVIWAARRASRLGVEVRLATSTADLQRWYSLYLQTMRKAAVPPRPYRLFEDLWRGTPNDHIKLFLAEQSREPNRRAVAGSMLLLFGQTSFYAFTGCAPEGLRIHANDILQTVAIRHACKNGFRWYDFGEVPEERPALERFKSKWGTTPRRLYRYYYPASSVKHNDGSVLAESVRAIWRILPTKATAVLGDFVYRFL